MLKVQMFGELTITYGEKTIRCEGRRARQSWNLLTYLLYYHDRVVSADELISQFWNGEASENPAGALKTSMHRLRALLDTLSPNAGHTMLLTKGGGYTWNPEYPIDLDTERFEALLDCDAPSLTSLTEALALYDGPFLRLQSSETWVLPLSAYYQNLYIDTLQQAVSLYEQEGRYEEALQACRKALAIDPYYEGGYQMSMRCLLEMGQRQEVIRVYEDMSRLLLSSFGVMPDQESRMLYHEAMRSDACPALTPEELSEQLTEEGPVTGALRCDFDFFRMLYQSYARSIRRTGQEVHMALFSFRGGNAEILAETMESLEEHLTRSLRKGDVVSRCSMSQIAVLLPMADSENSMMVCRRILERFRLPLSRPALEITPTVHPVIPV